MSHQLISSLNVLWGVLIPFRVLAGYCLGPSRVGTVSLVDFICMCPSLIPHLPVFRRKKIVCKDHVDIMEGEIIRLGNILELL